MTDELERRWNETLARARALDGRLRELEQAPSPQGAIDTRFTNPDSRALPSKVVAVADYGMSSPGTAGVSDIVWSPIDALLRPDLPEDGGKIVFWLTNPDGTPAQSSPATFPPPPAVAMEAGWTIVGPR